MIFHELLDGRRVLLAYSALDRLHDLYRSDASWVLFDLPGLERLREQNPWDVLYVDYDADLPANSSERAAEAGTW